MVKGLYLALNLPAWDQCTTLLQMEQLQITGKLIMELRAVKQYISGS